MIGFRFAFLQARCFQNALLHVLQLNASPKALSKLKAPAMISFLCLPPQDDLPSWPRLLFSALGHN